MRLSHSPWRKEIGPLRSLYFFSLARWICFLVGTAFLLVAGFLTGAFAAPPNYSSLKEQAERYFSEGSYARALELYQQAGKVEVPEEENAWVQFRLADTAWRSDAATKNPDPSNADQARTALEHMIRDIKRSEEQDRIWAEVHESLGDYFWLGRQTRNWSAAWNHYHLALNWWAGARDIELARSRYLHMVWTMASPPWRDRYYHYGSYGNRLPLDILENVLKISRQDHDRYRALYLIALTLQNQGGWNHAQRVQDAFEEALKAGKSSDWYDDALFQYAEWLGRQGTVVILDNGQQSRSGDFVAALQYYRKLVQEFSKGESRYYEQARQKIQQITQPTLSLQVSHIFLPDSLIEARLSWRNVDQVQISLFQVNLTRDLDLKGDASANAWIQFTHLDPQKRIRNWTEPIQKKNDHHPGNKAISFEDKLAPGAYILEARNGSLAARELILVTDAALVVKTAGNQALVYFADSHTGAPESGATVRLWERYYDDRHWHWRSHDKTTGDDGIAVFDLKGGRNSTLLATARSKERQAFSTAHNQYFQQQKDQWKLYVTTDRPAYRPKETAHWKITARIHDGSIYSTPSGQQIHYEINDPRGSKLQEGTLNLNEFGSGWDSLELSEALPLGEYRIQFWTPKKKRHLGQAALFRMEEYKLPEYKVSIQTPEEDGKKKTFLLGDTIEVDIQAEYYFGGPVANASVEVLVYQKAFHHYWRPQPAYPWYYEDLYRQPNRYWGHGQQVQRETLKTDANGRAHLALSTRPGGQDLEFRIEARVTDASRREVVSSGQVRVSRQKFFAHLKARHNLYQPNDRITVDLKTLDANQQPVSARGMVTITRDFWYEIWIDPEGREVAGEQLKALREASNIWPPPDPQPGKPGWKLKFRGYQHDDILTQPVSTNDEGLAEIQFTSSQEGYFRFHYQHEDNKSPPITTETTVWVATGATQDLGYRHGGLELIVDRDTFHAGQPAPVMISVPASDRYVLFSVEGQDLYSYQLVHVTGNVKLVTLDIEEQHVPNIFLKGVMISNRQLFQDTKSVVVPPVKQFLTVEVTPDREQYEPRQKGELTITTRDSEGKPVSAEVSLGLVDESIYAIQTDLAQDPRKFFFGQKKSQLVRTVSSFQMKRYARLQKNDKGNLEEVRSGQGAGDFRELNDAFSGRKKDFSQLKASRAPAAQYGARLEGASVSSELGSMADAAPMSMDEEAAKESRGGAIGGGNGSSAGPEIVVRSDFRSTVVWQPDVHTDRNGKATVPLTYPDSLTRWRATARAVTHDNRFGQDTEETQTQKPLIARLQAPRFFIVGDEVVITANLNNNTDQPLTVLPALEAEGITVAGQWIKGITLRGGTPGVKVPAHGQAKVDWKIQVPSSGEARLKLVAQGKPYGDAMEKTFPVYEHGIEKLLAHSGKMLGESMTVSLDLPPRKPGSTRMKVHVTPSLAVTMLDALPYLIDFPYGCTEQTLSRFLPTVIVAGTLAKLGLNRDQIWDRVFGGIDPEQVDTTHRGSKRSAEKIEQMVESGLDRLYDFQHSDGGWSWWKKGESDPFMSAYVLWGLTLALQAEVEVNPNVLNRAYDFLNHKLVEAENDFDLQAWELHATAIFRKHHNRPPSRFEAKAMDNLWNNRDRLNAYTRALLALTAHADGQDKKRQVLVRNLENGVVRDKKPDTSAIQRESARSREGVLGTAHWGEDGLFYRWSDGGVEATAFSLMAMMADNPRNSLVDPAMNWLVKNRRGAHWKNTRDTAIVLLAMTEFLKHSGELEATAAYSVSVNGTRVATSRITHILETPAAIPVDTALLKEGNNSITIRRTEGEAPLYFAAYAEFFSDEEPVTPAGNELFVRRQYYKQVGRPTLLKGYVYDKKPLNDGDSINSGDRIETVLTIESKNHYEYLVFEDQKPGGFEAVGVKSGQPIQVRELKSEALNRQFGDADKTSVQSTRARSKPIGISKGIVPTPQPDFESSDYTGRQRPVYLELRDRKVALFIDRLPQGVWEIRYDMRAEVPGRFHALPLTGHAMYIPEIRANGAEVRVQVQDRTP